MSVKKVAIVDNYINDCDYSPSFARALSNYVHVEYYASKKVHNKSCKPIWSTPFFPFQIFKVIIKDKPDVVHFKYEFKTVGENFSTIYVLFALMLLKAIGKNVVTTIDQVIPKNFFDNEHNSEIVPIGITKNKLLLKFLLFFIYGSISGLSDEIIVYSSCFKKRLLQYTSHSGKIHIVSHGIPDNTFIAPNKTSNDFIILNFGNITPRKGIETLLDAFAKLKYDNCKLMIVGSFGKSYGNKYSLKLLSLTKKLGIENNVTFTGYQSEESSHMIFQAADIVVFPYVLSFGPSGALCWAIQHRKPLIVSETEFFKEELSKDEALFFPIRDSYTLAKEMEELLNNRELQKKFSDKLEEKAKKESWDYVAQETIKLYGEKNE